MSYGTNAPFGLQPRRRVDGTLWNGATNQYFINSAYATSLFNGDPVSFNGDGTIRIATHGEPILGVFQSCQYNDANNNPVFAAYWQGGTVVAPTSGNNTGKVLANVCDDPNVLFDVQVSIPTAFYAGLELGDFDFNYNLAIGGTGVPTPPGAPTNPASGSMITGKSGYYLDYSSKTTLFDATYKAVFLTPEPGNIYATTAPATLGNGAYNNALVLVNNHLYKQASVGGNSVATSDSASASLTAAATFNVPDFTTPQIFPFNAGINTGPGITFDPTSGLFTVNSAGTYSFNAVLEFTSATTAIYLSLGIFPTGSTTPSSIQFMSLTRVSSGVNSFSVAGTVNAFVSSVTAPVRFGVLVGAETPAATTFNEFLTGTGENACQMSISRISN